MRGLRERLAALVRRAARLSGVIPAALGDADRERLAAELERYRTWVPPGHFYSPVPSLDEVRRDEARIFAPPPPDLPAVDLDPVGQLALLDQLRPYYAELPFGPSRQAGLRYFFENPNFGYADAIALYCMLRHLRPRRVVEIGSGYSSAVLLDTNERFFGGAIRCAFIEPYPELLRSLLGPGDEARVEIEAARLQDVDARRFAALEAGDVLFVDSTHVSKVDSDVNRIFFEILPRLAPGVHGHVHDVFYPFEYPREWIYEGRAWNENYVLRAFLQYNAAWQVRLFNNYLAQVHPDAFFAAWPLARRNPGGSIWLARR
jgi:hypothetical protein